MVIIKLCKPYRSPKQAVFIIVFTAVFVLISAATARYFPDIALYLRLTGGALLLLGAVLLFRFTMTEYVYALSGNVFSVRRINGFTESTVFSLELSSDTELYTKAEFKKKTTAGGTSYRQNLTASTAYLVYKRGSKRRYVEIEPNAEFFALLKKEIDENKKDTTP